MLMILFYFPLASAQRPASFYLRFQRFFSSPFSFFFSRDTPPSLFLTSYDFVLSVVRSFSMVRRDLFLYLFRFRNLSRLIPRQHRAMSTAILFLFHSPYIYVFSRDFFPSLSCWCRNCLLSLSEEYVFFFSDGDLFGFPPPPPNHLPPSLFPASVGGERHPQNDPLLKISPPGKDVVFSACACRIATTPSIEPF